MEFARTSDGKGFWRIDKGHSPEFRPTVLTLAAFYALKALIDRHHGDR